MNVQTCHACGQPLPEKADIRPHSLDLSKCYALRQGWAVLSIKPTFDSRYIVKAHCPDRSPAVAAGWDFEYFVRGDGTYGPNGAYDLVPQLQEGL